MKIIFLGANVQYEELGYRLKVFYKKPEL